MRKLISITLLGAVILSAGCIRSLHPIYTEKDIVFEPGLIGQWAEDDSKETWTFSREGTNAYLLIYTDDTGEQGAFSTRLLKIKENLFLDFFPEAPDLKENSFYQFHLMPVHTFVHVKQIEPTLQMAFPDPNWLKKHLADNPSAIRHERIENEIMMLTAATRDLQAFWIKHLGTEGAFADPSDMKRRQKTVPEEKPNKSAEGNG